MKWKTNLITGIVLVCWEAIYFAIPNCLQTRYLVISCERATVLKNNYIVRQDVLSSCLKSETRVLFRENLRANALKNFSFQLDCRYWITRQQLIWILQYELANSNGGSFPIIQGATSLFYKPLLLLLVYLSRWEK